MATAPLERHPGTISYSLPDSLFHFQLRMEGNSMYGLPLQELLDQFDQIERDKQLHPDMTNIDPGVIPLAIELTLDRMHGIPTPQQDKPAPKRDEQWQSELQMILDGKYPYFVIAQEAIKQADDAFYTWQELIDKGIENGVSTKSQVDIETKKEAIEKARQKIQQYRDTYISLRANLQSATAPLAPTS